MILKFILIGVLAYIIGPFALDFFVTIFDRWIHVLHRIKRRIHHGDT